MAVARAALVAHRWFGVCVITFVVTGTLVSMTVPMTRDGLSRVSDMAGEQSVQCVVVTIGGHTVLYAYSFLLSPFGYKPSFRTSLTPATTPVSDFGGIDYKMHAHRGW